MAAQEDARYSAIEETTKTLLAGFDAATRTQDMSHLSRHCAADCRRHLAPVSLLRVFGMPDDLAWTNADYETRMKDEIALLEWAACDMLDLTVDTRKRRAAARVAHRCKLMDKEPVTLEFVWILVMREDGRQVVSLTEFVDTAESLKYLEAMKEMKEAIELSGTKSD